MNNQIDAVLREICDTQKKFYGDGIRLHLAMIDLAERGRAALASPISEDTGTSTDEKAARLSSFDTDYIGRKLALITRDLSSYTARELERELAAVKANMQAMWTRPTMLPEQWVQADDRAALARFYECAMDSESGGHDVPKQTMARLAEIGLVQSKGFGRYQVTTFGDYVLGATGALGGYALPLKTYAEYNEESRRATLSQQRSGSEK